ncbi:MAG: UDP-N-acetylmuramoylalanyl-D-glutamyl-2,6-diaminopimelate--D-alanyl-D-alanine ligase [Alphaproteobacteria bacterium]|nr:UDP-N-acetylmuramoylalanyl-D-glutamyl-2,6-diaminopimelate--D-alanyl-D-alanine ligase [Alphaproteobacteria bacterium]
MSPLWTATEAAAATGGTNTGAWIAQGVSIDSRSLLPGDLFVALKGPKFDAHQFVAAAFDKGAAAAMVAKAVTDVAKPLLVVADTQTGLEELGRAARVRTDARVIGVTGSVGKTGTKEALRHAFEPQGATHASTGSLNNQWGVPLSLARMPRDTAFGVFEMGMNHPGEIDALTRLVQPNVAVITTVEPVHLGFFPSVEAIADAKAEIFNGMDPRSRTVLNRDNPYFGRLAERAKAAGISRIIDFGAHADAAVHLIDCHLHASASAVTASVQGEIVDYCLSLPGRHWVMNSLAVLAAVRAAGADIGTAAAAMATLEPMAGRGLRRNIAVAGGDALLIDESYNASPASMRAAIAVLGAAQPQNGGRRIAVLGDMLELGTEAARLHAELAGPLQDADVDLVFTVGDAMRTLHDTLPARRRGEHAAAAAEMGETVARRLKRGDVVMVKGSYGSRMREVVARLSAAAETARR